MMYYWMALYGTGVIVSMWIKEVVGTDPGSGHCAGLRVDLTISV